MWQAALMRQLRQFFIVAAISAGLYLLLYALVQSRVNPVVFVTPAPIDIDKYYHGKPVVSWLGLIAWALMTLIYALCIAIVGSRGNTESTPSALAVAVFIFSLAYLLIVHPLFTLTALPGTLGRAFSGFVEAHVPPLRAMYFGWNPFRYWPYVLLVHVIAVYAVVALSPHFGTSGCAASDGK